MCCITDTIVHGVPFTLFWFHLGVKLAEVHFNNFITELLILPSLFTLNLKPSGKQYTINMQSATTNSADSACTQKKNLTKSRNNWWCLFSSVKQLMEEMNMFKQQIMSKVNSNSRV